MTTASLEKRLKKLCEQASLCFPLMKGSVTIIGGKNQHPRFTWKTPDDKRRSLSLGGKKESIVKQYHTNYLRLQKIINDVSDINIELVKRMKDFRTK